MPLSAAAGDSAFAWIDDVEDFLAGLEEDGTLAVYDEGEQDGEVYVFFLTGTPEDDLLVAAWPVAGLAGVPAGAFAVVTDDSATEFGVGHRVGLPGAEPPGAGNKHGGARPRGTGSAMNGHPVQIRR